MFLVILMSLVNNVLAESDMEGFIVGGDYADIQNYPHSAFLYIECKTDSKNITSVACGSSIVNQVILLTAAHCLESCEKSTIITVFAGNVHRKQGMTRTSKQHLMHKKYNPKTIANDVALVKITKNLNLGKNTRRVVLMAKPPYEAQAAVAGWGIVDDVNNNQTLFLKHLVKVPVYSRDKCLKLLHTLPNGSFCAGDKKGKNYVSGGDSGSALIIRHYIQIGVVSFKYPTLYKSLEVYTDVAYFYRWIKKHAKKLYCKPLK